MSHRALVPGGAVESIHVHELGPRVAEGGQEEIIVLRVPAPERGGVKKVRRVSLERVGDFSGVVAVPNID